MLFRDGKDHRVQQACAASAGMAHIDYGLSILSAQALETYPAGAAFDLADLYRELSLRGELAGLEVTERFYEIGSLEGIEATERYLANHEGRG